MIDSVKAVIFDMDGLMLDTERVDLQAFKKAIAELGLDVPIELYFQVIGRTWRDTKQIFGEALGEDFPFDELRARWRQHTDEHITAHGVPTKLGLLTLLKLLQELGLPMAVATSTRREKALRLLEQAAILPHFAALACGDEISKGKPDPEIFLLAAKRLGADPEHCVALEDSPAGIRAAHAAGMIPILVPDLVVPPSDVVALAYCLCKSLDEACALFARRP